MIIYCKLGGELPKIEKLVKKFKIIMLVTIIVFGIALSFLSAAFACFSRIENTEKAERSLLAQGDPFL